MIDNKCIDDIRTNINPGVEYEIALFYSLSKWCKMDLRLLEETISSRKDSKRIKSIIKYSSPVRILNKLAECSLTLVDVSLETQNDNVGPADIVMTVQDPSGKKFPIGLSVKYSNTCTLNVTGKRFITDAQIYVLKEKLREYTASYIHEMNNMYGKISNWFRKRKPSRTTDAYIDLVRDAVIENWGNIPNKEQLFAALYHSDSPIEFWIVKYSNKDYKVNTHPTTIDFSRVNEVEIRKYKTSYVAFYLDGDIIGHMQVKFNNGFIESCKKSTPDIIEQNVSISYGKPFSSWNFSIEE